MPEAEWKGINKATLSACLLPFLFGFGKEVAKQSYGTIGIRLLSFLYLVLAFSLFVLTEETIPWLNTVATR